MARILAVFGVTSQQGSSVIQYVFQDPELSHTYSFRAITRDVSSEQTKQLEKKAEVVQSNVFNRASVEVAMTDVDTVFVMTMSSFGPDSLDIEYNSGKNIADVAVKKGVKYIIFSTLPSVNEISGGKFTKAVHFDAKAKVFPFLTPQPAADGTWVISWHTSPKTKLPLIDAVRDTGKYVGAILAEPDKFEGKIFYAATALYSLEDVAAIIFHATGKVVVYRQVSINDFKNSLPFGQDIFAETFSFAEEFGLFGPSA